jgi:hypothetical protein
VEVGAGLNADGFDAAAVACDNVEVGDVLAEVDVGAGVAGFAGVVALGVGAGAGVLVGVGAGAAGFAVGAGAAGFAGAAGAGVAGADVDAGVLVPAAAPLLVPAELVGNLKTF